MPHWRGVLDCLGALVDSTTFALLIESVEAAERLAGRQFDDEAAFEAWLSEQECEEAA